VLTTSFQQMIPDANSKRWMVDIHPRRSQVRMFGEPSFRNTLGAESDVSRLDVMINEGWKEFVGREYLRCDGCGGRDFSLRDSQGVVENGGGVDLLTDRCWRSIVQMIQFQDVRHRQIHPLHSKRDFYRSLFLLRIVCWCACRFLSRRRSTCRSKKPASSPLVSR